MAITAEQRKEVISLLVGMFDAAPSAELLTGFVSSIENGQSLESLANDLAATDEFASLYPVWLTNDEFATNFVTNILDGNTSAAALAEGIATVTGMLNGGATRGEAANQAVALLNAVPVTDTIWGQAAQGLANKVDVATYFATTKLTAASEFDALRAVVADVNATATSVSDQKILIDAGLDSSAQVLTTGQDFLEGSAGNDAFTAWIFDNQNTAQSGDSIKGGLGTDTLVAELGDSSNFAISLKTDSVEVAHFRAQDENDDTDDGANNVDDSSNDIGNEVHVDAQDMNGTKQFWSTDSRADLRIEDVRENSDTVTLGWRSADAGDVDYEVYFDTQHITAPGGTTAGSQLFLELLDLESMAAATGPLANNPYIGFKFSLDGVEYTVEGNSVVTTNYNDLLAGIQAALADNPALSGVTASLGNTFLKFNSDNGIQYQGTTIVLTNSGSEVLAGVGWTTPTGDLPTDTNIHTSISTTPPATTTQLTQTDVIFDNLGRGSKTGDFLAGNISTGATSGSKGIQQFNIDVDRNSWVKSVASTNNTLEEVFVESIGANGTVRIDSLTDVKVFDATAMQNSTTLTATLSDKVINKFLNSVDGAPATPGTDNDTFSYKMSGSNDSLTLSVAEEAVAREDFVLSVDGGAGDDVLTTSIYDADATVDLGDHWYEDQHTLKGLTVSGGSGNDTITTSGAGDFTIMAGSGNDTVYTDNSGAQAGLVLDDGVTTSKAQWVFNAGPDIVTPDNDVTDLAGAALVTTWLHDATVKVTYSGATTAGGGETSGTAVAGDNGFESAAIKIPVTNYMGTQANVNQAIKTAINADAVLSKLLVAVDGPDNTLIVKSRIDGTFAADDLVVDITAATWANYTAAEQTALNSAWDAINKDSDTAALTQGTLDGFVTAVEGAATTGYAAATLGEDSAAADIVGAASTVASDNVVYLSSGDDVLVLGTLEGADELGSDNDTIVFEDTSFGLNTIVNFDGTGNGADLLDFTKVLDTIVRTSASAGDASQAAANITYSADVNLVANEVLATGFTATATDTWAGLTAAELLDALNGDGDYANLVVGTAVSVNAAGGFGTDDGDVAETSQDHLLLVENNANDGEYKVFKLTSVSDAAASVDAGDFATAELLGTVDLGDGVAFATAMFV